MLQSNMRCLNNLLLYLLFFAFPGIAQVSHVLLPQLKGNVIDNRQHPLPGAQVMLMASDTLVTAAITNEKGDFILEKVDKREYVLRISMLGFKSMSQPVQVLHSIRFSPFILEEDTLTLSEVVVNADRRDLISFQTGSATFHLSTEALRSRDAFEALREIPKLVINETTRDVKLNDGRIPLILIDGVNRPGMISSLNPADIETVEVIQQASARYRGNEDATCIVNIKMRKSKDQMSVNGYVYSRHALPGWFGITGGSVSAGGRRASFYLNVQQFYFYHDDKNMANMLMAGDFIRHLSGNNRYSSNDLHISGGGDWLISDQNLLAYNVSVGTNPYHVKVNLEGRAKKLFTSSQDKVSSFQHLENNDFINTYGLYYRHIFDEYHQLEVTGNVGFFHNTSNGERKEKGDLYAYITQINLDNAKKSVELDLNFDFTVADCLTGNVGANTYFQKTKIDDLLDYNPFFNYKDWREYIYADIRNRRERKFSYRLSVGFDWVRTNAGGKKSSYINWVPSISLAYHFNNHSNLQMNLSRERVSPPISELNPCNTSTDSLRLLVGNPYLKPYMDNGIDLRYTFSGKGIYVEPYMSYNYFTDLIESTGSLQGNIYKQTYENVSSKHQFRAGFSTRWKLLTFGNLNLGTYYIKDFIQDCPFSGNGWGANGYLNLYYKKVSLSVNVTYQAASFSRLEKKWSTPESEALLTWNLSENWRLQAGLRYFASGSNRSRNWIKDGDYSYYNRVLYHDRFLMPMLGFSYIFHKKGTYKQRQAKQINLKDEGLGKIKLE